MPSSHQYLLNDQGLGCQVEINGDSRRIIPCGYHRDRAENVIMKLDSASRANTGNQLERIIDPKPCFVELARRLDKQGAPPAGGWYLVAEQREWLVAQLKNAISETNSREIRILEAGIASHNHHYSFLDLVAQALEGATRKPKIHVTIVDRCEYPIAISKTIHDELITEPNVRSSLPRMEDSSTELFLSFVISRRNAGQYTSIEQSFVVGDLRDPKSIGLEANSFDIITEHFISSVIANLDLLESFRRAYADLLRPGGLLLTAYGATLPLKEVEFQEVQDMHKRLRFVPGKFEYVWDPYGLQEDHLDPLLEEDPVSVTVISDNSVQPFRLAE